MKKTMIAPMDIRLMNLTAALLLFGLTLLLLGELGAWLARHPMFSIAGISVRGDVRHDSESLLRKQVMSRLQGTFLTIDLQAARESFEALPWVRRAVVRREFPNRLQVQLEEHRPAAFWGGGGAEPRLLNVQGEVFEVNLGELEHDELPYLSGPDEQSAEVLSTFRALQPRLQAIGLNLRRLELTGRGNWRAELDKDAVIELGRGTAQEVETRAARFVQTLPEVAARYGRTASALLSADLRHQDGYAIRLHGVSTVPATQARK